MAKKNKTGGGPGTNQYGVRGSAKPDPAKTPKAPEADLVAQAAISGHDKTQLSLQESRELAQQMIYVDVAPFPAAARDALLDTLSDLSRRDPEMDALDGYDANTDAQEMLRSEVKERLEKLKPDKEGMIRGARIAISETLVNYDNLDGGNGVDGSIGDQWAVLTSMAQSDQFTFKVITADYARYNYDIGFVKPNTDKVTMLGAGSQVYQERAETIQAKKATAQAQLDRLFEG